ncbi:MAG: hypothetical protein CVU71_01045 [Deltaproteobacteria bacterium HGW-Deltaproteobacteria-6]|jgi:hypothetical protein|nr:MAG: hypothetical protein CVU71_01045 [Deltaproteobacteria bacterium HGW-Deltaproteobacteria-6]
MKIYLASRYIRIEEMRKVADTLRNVGHEITSRWINGNHQISDDGLSAEAKEEERSRFATEDYCDLTAADCCINFTEKPRSTNSRGGRHVEFGMAVQAGIRLIVVGPRENVFHYLPFIEWYPDFQIFMEKCDLMEKSDALSLP